MDIVADLKAKADASAAKCARAASRAQAAIKEWEAAKAEHKAAWNAYWRQLIAL